MAEFLLRERSPLEVEIDFNCQSVPQQRLLSLGLTLVEVSLEYRQVSVEFHFCFYLRQTEAITIIWG